MSTITTGQPQDFFKKIFLVHLLHLSQPLSGLHRLELLRRPADGDADKGVEVVVALLAEEELTVVDHSDDLLRKSRNKSCHHCISDIRLIHQCISLL